MRRPGTSAVVLVLAVVGGLALVGAVLGGPLRHRPASAAATTVTTTGSTTAPTAGPATSSPGSPSTVSVLVANGTNVSGAAAHFTQVLQTRGWSMSSPVNATAPVSATAVYYASRQRRAADAVAAALGLRTGSVQPLAASTPVPTAGGIDVVVVLGPDLANRA